jgi:hypothetical protein
MPGFCCVGGWAVNVSTAQTLEPHLPGSLMSLILCIGLADIPIASSRVFLDDGATDPEIAGRGAVSPRSRFAGPTVLALVRRRPYTVPSDNSRVWSCSADKPAMRWRLSGDQRRQSPTQRRTRPLRARKSPTASPQDPQFYRVTCPCARLATCLRLRLGVHCDATFPSMRATNRTVGLVANTGGSG